MWTTLLISLSVLFMALVSYLVLALLLGARPRRRWLVLASLVHGLALLVLVTLWSNGLPGYFQDNALYLELRSFLLGPSDPLADPGADLILIDNSRSRSGVVGGEGQTGPITDRAELAELLRFLNGHSDELGLVVCDVLFLEPSAADGSLAAAVSDLHRKGLVLLARGVGPNVAALDFGPAVHAPATVGLQDGMVAAFRLMEEGVPGLPYAMYQRTEGVAARPVAGGMFLAETNGHGTALVHPVFQPVLDRLPSDLFATAREGPVSDAPAHRPLPLHTAVAPYGRVLLEDRLKHPRGGRKPVVFIGEFGEPGVGISADRHATLQGERGGALIILNTYLDLLAGAHRVSVLSLLLQFGVFTLVTLFVLLRTWPLVRRKGKGYSLLAWVGCARWPSSDEPEDLGQEKSSNWRSLVFRATRKHLGDLLLDLLPTALVFLLFLLLENGLDQHVNLAACLLYFLAFGALFGHLHSPPRRT